MRSRLLIVGIVLALLGLGRLALTVLHEPVLGYANQYDTIRVSACLGLWPDLPQPARYGASPAMPHATHVFGEARPGDCVYGSEVAMAGLAMLAFHAFDGGPRMDLRWVGGTKLAATALLVGLGCFLFWPFPRAALLHGLAVIAVLGDPLVGLWFNTLYAEGDVLIGGYALLAALAAIAVAGAVRWPAMALASVGIVLLGFAKNQFFLLPLVLVALALPVLWRADRRMAAAALVIALAPLVAFLLRGDEGSVRANRANAYFGAILASSAEPDRALERLGLPARCRSLVGASWYRPRGEDVDRVCPEVFQLGSASFVRLLAAEPRTLAVALARGVADSQNAFTGYLGFVSGRELGDFDALAPWHRSWWEPLFMHLPARFFAVLIAFAGALAALVFLAYAVLASMRRQGGAFPFAFVLVILAATFAYTYATAILADGYSETAKHVVLAHACLCVALVAGAAWWVHSWSAPVSVPARAATNVLVLASLVAAIGLAGAYKRLPLAMGVIDEPPGRLPPADVELRGWALDPYGIAAVEARVGGRRFPARIGLPKARLDKVYPTWPQSDAGGFVIALPADALAPGHPPVRVLATNRLGIETEIDRRE